MLNNDKSITFKIISHEKNKGLSEARNSGIKASTGDYLYFIDSDDDILENTFARYYSYLQEYSFVDVIMGNSLEMECNLLTNSSVTNVSLISDKQTIIYNLLCRKIDRHAWNKLIRRSFIVDNNLFFDTGLLYEDVTWTYRLFTTVSSVLIVPELTYMYEYNPSSIVHTHALCIHMRNDLVRSYGVSCSSQITYSIILPKLMARKCSIPSIVSL